MKTLTKIQRELKAPKNQRNNFGNYNYRSCEDILEAVKPLLGEAILTLNDEIVLVGDRYYVKATATIKEGEQIISTTAYAREDLLKKGMDVAQITGAASSYARKYALNGLFCIDDTKDADASNKHNKEISDEVEYINDKQLHELRELLIAKDIKEKGLCEIMKVDTLEQLLKSQFKKAKLMIEGAKKQC